MNTRQIIEALRGQGINVKYRERSAREGKGVRITEVGGVKFAGSKGNIYARALLGIDLSSTQEKHLASIKAKKGQFGTRKQNLAPVPDDIRKRIRDAQAVYRKRGIKEGKPTLRNYRYALKHKGKEEADRLLTSAERYGKGMAYLLNIDTFLQRVAHNLDLYNDPDVRAAYDILYRYYKEKDAENWTNQQLMDLYDLLYEWEKKVDETSAKNFRSYTEYLADLWKFE